MGINIKYYIIMIIDKKLIRENIFIEINEKNKHNVKKGETIQYLDGENWIEAKIVDIDIIEKRRLYTLKKSKPTILENDLIFNCCISVDTRNCDIIKLFSPKIRPIINYKSSSVTNIII